MLSEKTQKYFKNFKKEVDKVYVMAAEAKATGLDPVDKIEVPLATSMAQKVVKLIATVYPQLDECGIDKRILKLEEEYGKLDSTVVFKIAEEIARQKFCKFASLREAIDAGIRVGFAYTTLGVVASPIEGYTELKLEKTREGKEYFKVYFSGPIRSAGTTASCIALMLIDYLREIFGFAKYDPTHDEIERYVTENRDYHERITNLQYFPLEEEMRFLAGHLPIQIAGEPTEKIEVSNYKNLERVETNRIRGGMCLIFSEGLAQKLPKAYRLYEKSKKEGIKMTGFDFGKEYTKLHEELTSSKGKKIGDNVPVYIKDLVAGRPVYGHPSRSGGFRFRYGRARNSGFSAVAMHPATMAITDDFIAIGTQLKIEKPTKGCVVTSCDSVDGPIVKLFSGSVRKLNSKEEARKLYKDVEEIIYLGDILFPFSDVVNRNAMLVKPGYVEEWWNLELEKNKGGVDNYLDVSFIEAIELSREVKIPFYPRYIFYWSQISKEEFLGLINWLKCSWVDEKIIFPYGKKEQEKFELGKRALELLGVEHEVTVENVVLSRENSQALLLGLGLDYNLVEGEKVLLKDLIDVEKFSGENVLEIINRVCEFEIKDKAGDFIGSRMGRPEKAKLRKLTGSPNVLFPVGNEGGRLRSMQTALAIGKVKSHFPFFYCEKCDKETIYRCCEICGAKTIKKFYFYNLKEKSFNKEHPASEKEGTPYYFQSLDVNHYFNNAVEKLGMKRDEIPLLIKGVRGTSSGEHTMEHLCKGILRAKYGLQVNKDGTIRVDGTELPLTAFKPKEIGVGIKRLKELGYTEDMYGKELVDENQVLELMPHDILLPISPESPDEKADEVFINVANFIDEELEKFYGLKKFYNLKTKEDLVGKLGVCMAPHNCAGVICRFIGFANVLGLMASPYMHAAIRRDCDGDEMAVMLLGDVLLNFSRKFLPSHRGGTQDAPLVLNSHIDAGEVDDQILDYEFVNGNYPLELYKKAEKRLHSSEIKEIKLCSEILKEGKDPFLGMGFTHGTFDFNEGVACSSYKTLPTMQDKVRHQMELVEKIRAVDTSDTARLILDRHFIRDMRGNLRNFSTQSFRCVGCNEIVRRPPLNGVCPVCRGKLIFTVHEGGIKKYLEPALDLAGKYDLSPYLKQNLELIKRYIDSIFGRELEKQKPLNEFF